MGDTQKLNLGAGWRPLPGYVNHDLTKLDGIDVAFDLNAFPYPLEDSSFDEVCVFDVLEHLDDYIKVLKEIHRILKPGGVVKIVVPHWNSNGVFFDPTHKHGFGHTTFEYFVKGFRSEFDYYFDFQYSSMKRKIMFSRGLHLWNWIISPIANAFPRFYETTPFKIFPSEGIYVELVK